MPALASAMFNEMITKAGKGVSKAQAKKLDAPMEQALAKELGDLGKALGKIQSVDRLALSANKHGEVRFKVRATTLKGGESLIAKIKGWFSKEDGLTLQQVKLASPKAAGGMDMPVIESGGAFSRPTGGWNPYLNLVDQDRIGF